MTKPIDPKALKELRRRQGWSQQELARRAKLTKGSLHRLEAGRQPGSRRRTLEGLAKALDVEAGVLTGEIQLPVGETGAGSKVEAAGTQMNLRVNAAARNAFWLASRCYSLPVTRIVELAPYLLVCAAEASLARRRARVAELEAVLDRMEKLGDVLPHLRNAIGPAWHAREALAAEKASIAKRDVLAADFADGAPVRSKVEGIDDAGRDSYEPGEQNPFILYLREAGPADTRLAEIHWLDRSSAAFAVCYADAMALAGGDEELAEHIVYGFVALHEMPRELSSGEASARRLEWLRENSPTGDISEEELARYYPPDDEGQAP